jgi:LPXTG-site transpeptidase (sortase) family protein
MALVVVLAVLGVGGVSLGLRSSAEPPPSPGADQRGTLDVGSSRGPALPRSVPARLDVPSVGIHTDLVRLGLNPDGTLEVPSEPLLAGWYTGSPTSGERGPSVIAGHVDSVETGPAVFYRLGQVQPGDRIEVTREDGIVAHFTATAVRAYAKSDFPTQTVYGNTSRATLRLITCGDWNDESRSYDGNVVVFAQLDPPRSGAVPAVG